MNEPLPYKKIEFKMPHQERVMFLDPIEIYERIKIYPFNRNPSPGYNKMFPQHDKSICSCGCNRKLTGKRTRWATQECSEFATSVYSIIQCHLVTVKFYLKKYYGWKCCKCGSENDLKIDHIIPVKYGGGGCWLSNFQILCHDCHVKKTNKDFGWKQEEKLLKNQLSLQLS